MAPDKVLSVRILDPQVPPVPEDVPHSARVGSLTAPIPVAVDPGRAPVRLVLTTVRYTRNGQTYLPDTSDTQLQLYREVLKAAVTVYRYLITVYHHSPPIMRLPCPRKADG